MSPILQKNGTFVLTIYIVLTFQVELSVELTVVISHKCNLFYMSAMLRPVGTHLITGPSYQMCPNDDVWLVGYSCFNTTQSLAILLY